MAINVVVQGALGRMGQEVVSLACRDPELQPVGAADANASSSEMGLPDGFGAVPLARDLAEVLDNADVVVDFTNADGARGAITAAAARKVNIVIGSTGIPEDTLARADALARDQGMGILVAPNFALGAVIMVHLAKVAAPYFDYADLTETHHEAKIDAPSGTAVAIARAAVEGKGGAFTAPKDEKEIIAGTRCVDNDVVTNHIARMPGRVAHHELVFGALGQTLTLRHDSINRESFMPGVAMAIRHVVANPGLVVGLENILGL